MKRLIQTTPVVMLLALATTNIAQAENFLKFEATPGISRIRPAASEGVATSNSLPLKDYVKILRAVELAVNFEAKRHSNHNLEPISLSAGTKISAKVKFEREGPTRHRRHQRTRPGGATSAKVNEHDGGKLVLKSLELQPQGKLEVSGKQIKSAKFTSKGELHIEMSKLPLGIPRIRITKIRKTRKGKTIVELAGLPDLAITKDGKVRMWGFRIGKLDGDFELPEWPPNLEDLLKYVEPNSQEPSDVNLADVVSKVNWNVKAVAEPHKIDFLNSQLPQGNYRLDLSGQARNVNGALQTYGKNHAKVSVTVGDKALGLGSVAADQASGKINLDGAYRLSLPLDKESGETVRFDFDGRADFDLTGQDVKVRLPKNTAVSTGAANVQGAIDAQFSYSEGRPSLKLDKGRYNVTLNGPMTIQGAQIPGLKTDNTLGLDGQVELKGTLRSAGRRLVNRASLRIDAIYHDERGFAGVIADATRNITFLGQRESRIQANVEEFVVYRDLASNSKSPDYLLATPVKGTVDLDLLIEEGRYQDDKITLDLPKGPHRLSVSSDFKIGQAKDLELRNSNVKASLELGSDVSYEVRKPKAMQRFAIVKVKRLNVRSGPDQSFSKLGVVKFGEKLTILKDAVNFEGEPWYLIEGKNSTGRSIKGYIAGRYAQELRKELPGLVVDGTIKKGSRLELDLKDLKSEGSLLKNLANVIREADGQVGADIELGPTNLSMGALKATLKSGRASVNGSTKNGLNGRVNLGDASLETGDSRANLSGHANADVEIGQADESKTRPVKVTFSIALNDGSTFQMNNDDTAITVNGKGSNIRFTVLASIGPDGQPKIHSLEDVDATVELGETSAKVLGRDMGLPGEKILRLQGGRIAIHDNGLDIFGDLSVTVRSVGDMPALRVRW